MLILGTEYKLIWDDGVLKKENADGECEEYTKVIRLRHFKDMLSPESSDYAKKKRYKEVLRHEAVHAFFTECGLDNYSQDEQLVDWIAVQFPKMLKVFQKYGCTD